MSGADMVRWSSSRRVSRSRSIAYAGLASSRPACASQKVIFIDRNRSAAARICF